MIFVAVEFFLSRKFDEGQTNFPESTHDAITYAAVYIHLLCGTLKSLIRPGRLTQTLKSLRLKCVC